MRKIIRIILGSFLGIAFIIIGISTYINNNEEAKNAITIEATITKIEENYRAASGQEPYYQYDLYVDYTFDNVEYNDKKINLSSNLYNIGDKIEVKVNPDNPDKPIYIEQSKFAIIIIIIGIILILFEIILNIFMFK